MPQKRRRHSRPLAKIGASALSLLLVASMWPGIGFADDVQREAVIRRTKPRSSRTPHPSSPMLDYSEWYGDAVNFIASKGLITRSPTVHKRVLFGIGDTLTRAQFATILWRNACPYEYATYDPTTAVDTTGIRLSASGTVLHRSR